MIALVLFAAIVLAGLCAALGRSADTRDADYSVGRLLDVRPGCSARETPCGTIAR